MMPTPCRGWTKDHKWTKAQDKSWSNYGKQCSTAKKKSGTGKFQLKNKAGITQRSQPGVDAVWRRPKSVSHEKTTGNDTVCNRTPSL